MSCAEPPPPQLIEGIAQFNRGEFFEQHETLELRYLAPFAPRCQRVNVEALLQDAAAALAEVERLGPARLGEFDWRLVPKVRIE